MLPLLRRTFAEYEPGVRRTVGRAGAPAAARGCGGRRERRAAGEGGRRHPSTRGFGPGLDTARADAVLPVLRLLLAGGEREVGEEAAA